MLAIYKTLFNNLKENKIFYCVYKGLDYFEKNLSGDNCDIDIILPISQYIFFKRICIESGFKHETGSFPKIFLGLDIETLKYAMIDIRVFFELGSKPYCPYKWEINVFKLKYAERSGASVLHDDDYLPLSFLRFITLSNYKANDLKRLQALIHRPVKEGYISSTISNFFQLNWNNIKESILCADTPYRLSKKYRSHVKRVLRRKHPVFFLIKKMQKTFKIFEKIYRRIFGIPCCRIRKKGKLIVFVGVDGAGKTSAIEYLKSIEYFSITGIKKIYFGNNQYLIPGLNIFFRLIQPLRLSKFIIAPLSLLDRKLRFLKVLYYLRAGNTVLADRYYYDDLIYRKIPKNESRVMSLLKKTYYAFFSIKFIKEPDLTFYLDVSPEIAYQRKQDYDYQTMLLVNDAYKNFFYNRKNTFIIDADKPQHIVFREIINGIAALDRREIFKEN